MDNIDKSVDSDALGYSSAGDPNEDGATLMMLLDPLLKSWRLLAGVSLVGLAVGYGVASLVPKWYTAVTVIMPPQQQQSSAATAVAQLGALAGLAGNLGAVKSPADQYVALMQSTTVSDRIVERFNLVEAYDVELRVDARRKLSKNARVSAGRKDGLITVEVDDRDPKRAADMANAYVESLREMTTRLAVSEAQQRRVFFEEQLKSTRERLTQAQVALESAGVGQGVLKADPRSAAESYARLRAEVTAAEVRLQAMRRMLTDSAPEVQQQQASVAALREQLGRAEGRDDGRTGSEYITKYRNFKYEEALFDIFSKQYELARVDESREGALIQVVDRASPPERHSGPRRMLITGAGAILAFLLTAMVLVGRSMFLQGRK